MKKNKSIAILNITATVASLLLLTWCNYSSYRTESKINAAEKAAATNTKMVAEYTKKQDEQREMALNRDKTHNPHAGVDRSYQLSYDEINLNESQSFIDTNEKKLAKVDVLGQTVFIGKYDNAEKAYRDIRVGDKITTTGNQIYKVNRVEITENKKEPELNLIKTAKENEIVIIIGTESGVYDHLIFATSEPSI